MIEGLDISHYQASQDGKKQFLMEKAKDKVGFIYIKSSEGKDPDSQYLYNVGEANKYEMPYGIYHYLKPSKNLDTQVTNFSERIGENLLSPYFVLYPIVDVEETGNLNKTLLEGFILKFIMRVEERTNKTLGIYTSQNFWNNYLPRTDWAKTKPLLVASWGTIKPSLPKDWEKVGAKFHQYRVSKDGFEYGSQGDDDIDHDKYMGDSLQFKSEFGIFPNERKYLMKEVYIGLVVVPVLNIRNSPSTNSSVVGQLKLNDKPEVIEVIKSGANTWGRVGQKQFCAMEISGKDYLILL